MGGLPVTVAALVVTLFLFPGVAFVVGLFASPTVNRDASTLSAPLTFALVIASACVVNLIAGFFFWLGGCAHVQTGAQHGFCQPFGQNFSASLALGDLLFFMCLSAALSSTTFGLGRWVTRQVESGALSTEALHGWAYEYVCDPNPKAAFVLTRIGEGCERVGYEGTLHSLRLTSDGTIRTVTLRGVSRFRVSFAAGATEHRTRIDTPGNAAWDRTDLVIPGAQIENIAIRSLPSFSRLRLSA